MFKKIRCAIQATHAFSSCHNKRFTIGLVARCFPKYATPPHSMALGVVDFPPSHLRSVIRDNFIFGTLAANAHKGLLHCGPVHGKLACGSHKIILICHIVHYLHWPVLRTVEPFNPFAFGFHRERVHATTYQIGRAPSHSTWRSLHVQQMYPLRTGC